MKQLAPLLFQAVLWSWCTLVLAALQVHYAESGDELPIWCLVVGAAVGALLAAICHPFRRLGLVPVAWAGLTGLVLWFAFQGPTGYLLVIFGGLVGLAATPLLQTSDEQPPAARLKNVLAGVAAMALAILVTVVAAPAISFSGLVCIAAAGALGSFAVWLRSWLELMVAFVFLPQYRFRECGPGAHHFPRRGPVVVIANHSAYLDPFWLGKVIPRPITPMMTSYFYDRPFIHFMMRHVIHAIRVQDTGFRREAPELAEAIARLDAGECLVIFPEARLRTEEDQLLRKFGQGVWHILKDRPQTPVVPIWIEGGWGSFFSYKDGLPTKNKRIDRARPITIVVGEPKPLPEEALKEHRTTRQYLMDAVLDLRKELTTTPTPTSN